MNGRIEFEGWFQTSSAAPLWIYCEYNNCWTFAIWLHSYWAIKHTPLFDTTIQSYRAFKDTINQGEEGPKTQVNLLCKQCIVQRKLWFVCTGRRLTLTLTSTYNQSKCILLTFWDWTYVFVALSEWVATLGSQWPKDIKWKKLNAKYKMFSQQGVSGASGSQWLASDGRRSTPLQSTPT